MVPNHFHFVILLKGGHGIFILGFIFLQMGEVVKKIALTTFSLILELFVYPPVWEMCILSNAKTVTPNVLDELLKGPFMNLYTGGCSHWCELTLFMCQSSNLIMMSLFCEHASVITLQYEGDEEAKVN